MIGGSDENQQTNGTQKLLARCPLAADPDLLGLVWLWTSELLLVQSDSVQTR